MLPKLYMLNKLLSGVSIAGARAGAGAAPATRGACTDILFCIAMCRAPTPPTAVNFFFAGMSPVLLEGMIRVYIMETLI